MAAVTICSDLESKKVVYHCFHCFPIYLPWSDYEKSCVPKNWCFWTMVLEKTLESPLDCKEIQPVHPKGNRSWIFIGRTDVKAEMPIFSPRDVKNWLVWKDLDAGKDWRQKEKGMTEDEMAGWHHRLWTCVWVNSRSWWWTGRPGVLQFMGSQRVRQDWVTELNWTELMGPEAMTLVFWMLSLSQLFHFHQETL